MGSWLDSAPMKTVYYQPTWVMRPKRGDLLQTNIGDKRERTMIVLAVHVLPTQPSPEHWNGEWGNVAQRTRIWAERWWELEPEMRVALFRSAERNGGQLVHSFKRFPAKKKVKTFAQYLGAK